MQAFPNPSVFSNYTLALIVSSTLFPETLCYIYCRKSTQNLLVLGKGCSPGWNGEQDLRILVFLKHSFNQSLCFPVPSSPPLPETPSTGHFQVFWEICMEKSRFSSFSLLVWDPLSGLLSHFPLTHLLPSFQNPIVSTPLYHLVFKIKLFYHISGVLGKKQR